VNADAISAILDDTPPRPWYAKKRYLLPLIAVGVGSCVALLPGGDVERPQWPPTGTTSTTTTTTATASS